MSGSAPRVSDTTPSTSSGHWYVFGPRGPHSHHGLWAPVLVTPEPCVGHGGWQVAEAGIAETRGSGRARHPRCRVECHRTRWAQQGKPARGAGASDPTATTAESALPRSTRSLLTLPTCGHEPSARTWLDPRVWSGLADAGGGRESGAGQGRFPLGAQTITGGGRFPAGLRKGPWLSSFSEAPPECSVGVRLAEQEFYLRAAGSAPPGEIPTGVTDLLGRAPYCLSALLGSPTGFITRKGQDANSHPRFGRFAGRPARGGWPVLVAVTTSFAVISLCSHTDYSPLEFTAAARLPRSVAGTLF